MSLSYSYHCPINYGIIMVTIIMETIITETKQFRQIETFSVPCCFTMNSLFWGYAYPSDLIWGYAYPDELIWGYAYPEGDVVTWWE